MLGKEPEELHSVRHETARSRGFRRRATARQLISPVGWAASGVRVMTCSHSAGTQLSEAGAPTLFLGGGRVKQRLARACSWSFDPGPPLKSRYSTRADSATIRDGHTAAGSSLRPTPLHQKADRQNPLREAPVLPGRHASARPERDPLPRPLVQKSPVTSQPRVRRDFPLDWTRR